MSAKVHPLRSVDGEVPPDALSYGELATINERQERELDGYRLRIAKLEHDRDEWARNHPLLPEIECIAACWRRATGRRREVDATDVENIARALYVRDGFRLALTAIAGASYDPNSTVRRNGKKVIFNDLELIFRNAGKRQDFIDRAPEGYQPSAEKVAAIAEVSVEWVEERLRPGWKAQRESQGRRAA